MNAIGYRARAELRARRRSMLAIAVLLGLGGGAVMAAAAGARRTDSAYPRLLERTAGAHLIVGAEVGTARSLSASAALADPAVVAVKPYRLYLMLAGPVERCEIDSCVVGVAGGEALGGPVDGMKLVSGRLPDQADPSQVVLTVVGAQELGVRVGDTFPLRGVPFGEPFTTFEQRARRDPLTMRVVGVVATPGDFPPQIGDETIHLRLTRAFYDRYPEPSFGLTDVLALRFTHGQASIAPFLRRVFPSYPDTFPSERVSQDDNVQRSFHLQALALWALAGVAGLTLLLIVSQALARELHLGSDDNSVLATLGLTRFALWTLGLARAGVVAVAGAAIAIPVAIALSPLLPRGLPRTAEPDPGLAVDWLVAGVGAAAMLVLVVASAAWPAFRVARADEARRRGALRRTPSIAGELVARLGAPPSLVAGTRMALEPGRGRTAVPVRTTITGMTIGVVAVAATLSFGSSLDHLVATPRLYGVTFDMVVGAETVDFEQRAGEVLAMPEVAGIAWGMDVAVFAGDVPLTGVMLDTAHAALQPPVLEGRAPRAGPRLEAVLGAASARRLGVTVGDTFAFEVPNAATEAHALVVGIGALPTFDDTTALSDGVWFSLAGVEQALGAQLPADKAFIDLAPGADATQTFHRMGSVLGVPIDADLWRPQIGTPADLVSFGNVRSLPLVLAGLIGLIAIGMLGHTVRSATRRRARDLALLKTLGFKRSQTRAAVTAHAAVLATITVAVGIPIGMALGRWLWRTFAEAQGVIAEPVVSVATMASTGTAVLLLALLVAAGSVRAAARTRPALILHAE